MTEKLLKQCFLMGSILALIATFSNLIYLVNAFDSMTENSSNNVVAAFDG